MTVTDGSTSARASAMSKQFQGRPKVMYAPPSAAYPEVEAPPAQILRRAEAPPSPTLPRRPTAKGYATSSFRSSLRDGTGKQGEVVGRGGGRYAGEVLAGRPHGVGSFFVPSSKPGEEMRLQYEGEWFQGRREGQGTFHYRLDEVYTGGWLANERSGFGKMNYRNGDYYDGQWKRDKRHGNGVMVYANGDIFNGLFSQGKKEGLGVFFAVSRGLKFEGEWHDDQMRVGEAHEFLQEELEELVPDHSRLRGVKLPMIELARPAEAQLEPYEAVRAVRETTQAGRDSLNSTGELRADQLERLKHAFRALRGSSPGLLVTQLRDLCVLSGLDPSAVAVPQLAWAFAECTRKDGILHEEDFLRTACAFRLQA